MPEEHDASVVSKTSSAATAVFSVKAQYGRLIQDREACYREQMNVFERYRTDMESGMLARQGGGAKTVTRSESPSLRSILLGRTCLRTDPNLVTRQAILLGQVLSQPR